MKKDLKEKTFELSRRIVRMFVALPKTRLAQALGLQVLRSGTSVGANYREANQGRSKAEFIAKIGDCLKEPDENLYWLDLLAAENVMASERLGPLQGEVSEIIAIFTTILKNAKRSSGK
ncbi:MAG: four helix bundle protein [Verrucomicrobiales bacterium]